MEAAAKKRKKIASPSNWKKTKYYKRLSNKVKRIIDIREITIFQAASEMGSWKMREDTESCGLNSFLKRDKPRRLHTANCIAVKKWIKKWEHVIENQPELPVNGEVKYIVFDSDRRLVEMTKEQITGHIAVTGDFPTRNFEEYKAADNGMLIVKGTIVTPKITVEFNG